MSLRKLAEGIILQSVEDLWNEDCREDCITFFKGKDFRLCAEVAGMNLSDQVRLLNLVKASIESMKYGKKKKAGQQMQGTHEKNARDKQLERSLNFA